MSDPNVTDYGQGVEHGRELERLLIVRWLSKQAAELRIDAEHEGDVTRQVHQAAADLGDDLAAAIQRGAHRTAG